MTLTEAEANIGRAVVYTTYAYRVGSSRKPPEDGIIRRVGREYVFVEYSFGIAATRAEDLDFHPGFPTSADV